MSLPPNFIKEGTEGKIIPFIGAGVSMNVRDKNGKNLFLDWKNLLLESVIKLEENGKDSSAQSVGIHLEEDKLNYLKAAKQAQKHLGSEFYDLIKEKIGLKFENVDEKSLILPKTIWEISNNLIITTNYDRVLYWTCPNPKDLTFWDIQARKEQADLIKAQVVPQPTIWYLHGQIDNISNIILTPDGYERLYPKNSASKTEFDAALATLKILFISHTFLFIGFSLDDKNFVSQLKYVQDLFQGTLNKHYVLIREQDKAKLNSLGIEIEPITFESFGDKMLEKLFEIRNELNSLKGKTASLKEFLTSTERHDPKNPVVYIPYNQKGAKVIGREKDLDKIRNLFLLENSQTNIGQAVSIQGFGGLGKTQLAIEYAYKYQSEYPNGVIWLTANQDIERQLEKICNKAKWDAPHSPYQTKRDVARQRLKNITDCLIVLDDVEDFDEIKDYLPEPQKNVHILATSRYEIIGFNPISLKPLTTEQAVQMLKQESHREIEEEESATVAKIAEELGNLPLALELAGIFICRREPSTWKIYLDLLQKYPHLALNSKFLLRNFTHHDIDIYQTLSISEEFLNEEAVLKDILDLLTWSGNSPMGVNLMSVLLGKNEVELFEALGLGLTLSFLQKSPEREAYAIHRLVAQVRKEEIPLRKEEIPLSERTDWVNNICQTLGSWFQSIKDKAEKISEYKAEFEHLATWQKIGEIFSPKISSELRWLQAYPAYHQGDHKKALDILNEALEIYRNGGVQNLTLWTNINNDIERVSDLKNSQKLADVRKKAFGIQYKKFGGKNFQAGNSNNHIQLDNEKLKENREQLEKQKRLLKEHLEHDGEKHVVTPILYNRLAAAYGNLEQFENQLENQKKALKIHVELHRENHPETAVFYNDIGTTYGNLGQFEEQLKNQLKAIEIQNNLSSEKNSITAVFYNNIGTAYGNLERFEEQLESQKKSLSIRLKLPESERSNSDIAASYNDVGIAYGNLGQVEEQLENQKKALDIQLNLLGENHPDTAASYYNLSFIYEKLNDNDSAIDFAKRNCNACSTISKSINLDILNSIHRLLEIDSSNETLGFTGRILMQFSETDPLRIEIVYAIHQGLEESESKDFNLRALDNVRKKLDKKRR